MAKSKAQIKKALRDGDWTYEKVAHLVKPPLSRQTIYSNVNKLPGCTSRRARELIAQALGEPYEEVWGTAA